MLLRSWGNEQRSAGRRVRSAAVSSVALPLALCALLACSSDSKPVVGDDAVSATGADAAVRDRDASASGRPAPGSQTSADAGAGGRGGSGAPDLPRTAAGRGGVTEAPASGPGDDGLGG